MIDLENKHRNRGDSSWPMGSAEPKMEWKVEVPKRDGFLEFFRLRHNKEIIGALVLWQRNLIFSFKFSLSLSFYSFILFLIYISMRN